MKYFLVCFYFFLCRLKSLAGDRVGRQIAGKLRKEGKAFKKFPEYGRMGKTIVKIVTPPYRKETQCSKRLNKFDTVP